MDALKHIELSYRRGRLQVSVPQEEQPYSLDFLVSPLYAQVVVVGYVGENFLKRGLFVAHDAARGGVCPDGVWRGRCRLATAAGFLFTSGSFVTIIDKLLFFSSLSISVPKF